jgi:LuxR family transcriptional regulator, maltose regulon positive regulatory protein
MVSETGGDARPLPRDPGVLRTKLTPPPPWVKAVPRPQLLARLGTPRALTVICAPAGYGKTSTAVAWLASLGQRLAWVSLDRRDDDPARFLRSLAAAVRTVAPDCGRAVAAVGDRLRESDVPFLVERLLDDLHQTDAEFTLVLDDFQFLADPAILAAIETLVEGLTPKLSIVIVTREEPPLPLARWRLRGRLAELGQDELRFSPGEAEAFFNASMGLGLSSDDIARLHDRSEGWIGGLQMAALSMQGERDRATIIDAFDGRNRYVMDYLVEEVLAAQPPEIGRFLLRTSVLDRMCAGLCEAVTGMPDSAAILDRLERARLFVVPLDDRREWFRYHALFADLLRHQLARSAGDRMGDCQTAASRWFERQGFIDDAAEYALAAGDAERVAAIAETYGRDMIIAGQSKRLHALLSQVPADRLAGNADRLSVALWARFNREGVCPPALLADLKAAVRADPDAGRRARNASDLRLIEAIEAVRTHRDHARAIALVAPEEGAEGFASPLAQSIAPTLLAAAAHKSGDRARATASYAGAVDAALGQRAVTTFFLSALGLGRLTSALRGPKAGLKDLERARSTAERMGWGDLPFMSWLLCGEAECAEEMDDPAAESLYGEAIRLARLEPPVVRHVARVGLAGILWRSGRRDEADAALEELSRVPYAEPFMPVLPDFEVAWARHDLARGRSDRATDLIKRRETVDRDAFARCYGRGGASDRPLADPEEPSGRGDSGPDRASGKGGARRMARDLGPRPDRPRGSPGDARRGRYGDSAHLSRAGRGRARRIRPLLPRRAASGRGGHCRLGGLGGRRRGGRHRPATGGPRRSRRDRHWRRPAFAARAPGPSAPVPGVHQPGARRQALRLREHREDPPEECLRQDRRAQPGRGGGARAGARPRSCRGYGVTSPAKSPVRAIPHRGHDRAVWGSSL